MKKSKELIEMAVSLYKNGVSGNEIAKKIHVSPPTVYEMLKIGGIVLPKRTETNNLRLLVRGDDALNVIKDYNEGMGWKKLEEKYNYGQYSMREAIRRAGVKIKDHGGQRRRLYKHEENEVIRLFIEEKFSQTQIVAKMNISQTVISRVLKVNGINCGSKTGELHHNWKGGVSKNGGGYILIRDNTFPSMLNRSGYVLQHRLNMANHLKRALSKNETVHHIDGDKSNNDISNLQVMRGAHIAGVAYCCLECGSRNIKTIKI